VAGFDPTCMLARMLWRAGLWWVAVSSVCAACAAAPAPNGAGNSAGSAGTGGAGAGGAGVGGDAGAGGAGADGDAGAHLDASAHRDAGSAGPWAVPALPFTVGPGEPIAASDHAWSFVPFEDARCANGTSTGLAIKTAPEPKGLLIFLQGGGACWDANTCLTLDAAVHVRDTVDETVVLSELNELAGLFDHTSPLNPFRDYAFVYIPYCTGDLHSGTRSATYQGGSGPVTLQHVGGRNMEAYLARLVPTFAGVERVVLSGVSAGGFGATLNWWRVQNAFSQARVDLWDDAGLLVDPNDSRWVDMQAQWGAVLPPACAACADRLSAFPAFYAQHLIAPRRYALSGFLGDAVISGYFGIDAAAIEAQLLAERADAATNHKTFFLEGSLHSVLGDGLALSASDGQSLVPWLHLFEGDDPSWDHAGP
jgi:hypothetical protein